MAGHSKFSNIKHRKAAVDKKRSKLWSKLSKAIIVAARMGGGDPAANARLRNAIQDAKANSLPKDNIERAIKKGVGELGAGDVAEILYEGYGAGGVAVLCDIMTDNRNRTASEVRLAFDRNGGNLGSSNCVGYLFERKGVIDISKESSTLDDLLELAMEAGSDDVEENEGGYRIICPPDAYPDLLAKLEEQSIEVELSEVTRLPSTTVQTDDDTARKVMSMIEALEEHDDVQSVSSNLELTAEQSQSFET